MMKDVLNKKVGFCPICDSGNVHPKSKRESLTDRHDNVYQIEAFEYTTCDECGCEYVTATQARSNERQLADARRTVAGLLSTDEVRQIRKKHELRQEDASLIFGGGPNAFSKYERGYISQSIAMDRLLRVADEFPEVVPFLAKLSGKAAIIPKTTLVARLEEVSTSIDATLIITKRLLESFDKTRIVETNPRLRAGFEWSSSFRRVSTGRANDDSWLLESIASNG